MVAECGVLVMNPMTVHVTLKRSVFLNIPTLKRLYDILIKTSFFVFCFYNIWGLLDFSFSGQVYFYKGMLMS